MAQALKYPTSQNFVQKTLGATLLAGANVATLSDLVGVQNQPGVFIIDRVDANNLETPAKREVCAFTGTSGVTTTGLVKNADGSGTDQAHAVGAIIEFSPDILWAQSIVDALTQVIAPSTGLLDTTKVADLSTAQTLTNKSLANPNITVGSDAAGDLYYRSVGASISRLAKGSAGNLLQQANASLPGYLANGTFGQVLVMNASLPAWGTRTLSPYQVITDASTMYLDFNVGNKFMATIVPSAARTFLITNATIGDVGMLRVKYASTASLALNLITAGATISWGASLPVPTAILNKVDVFGFACMASIPKFDGYIISQGLTD